MSGSVLGRQVASGKSFGGSRPRVLDGSVGLGQGWGLLGSFVAKLQ